MESATSTGTGVSRSHRSSFAVERLSLDGSGQAPGANETPQPALSQQHLESMCQQLGIPNTLCNRYVAWDVQDIVHGSIACAPHQCFQWGC